MNIQEHVINLHQYNVQQNQLLISEFIHPSKVTDDWDGWTGSLENYNHFRLWIVHMFEAKANYQEISVTHLEGIASRSVNCCRKKMQTCLMCNPCLMLFRKLISLCRNSSSRCTDCAGNRFWIFLCQLQVNALSSFEQRAVKYLQKIYQQHPKQTRCLFPLLLFV
jgi:hypothetical protein